MLGLSIVFLLLQVFYRNAIVREICSSVLGFCQAGYFVLLLLLQIAASRLLIDCAPVQRRHLVANISGYTSK